MSFLTLIIVALGSTFAICWLINYVPLRAKIFSKPYSPRLLLCKFLAPFDATITLILILGGWLGLTTAMLGISMIIYNTLTGIGISMGVLFTKKVLVPHWEKKYIELIEGEKNE